MISRRTFLLAGAGTLLAACSDVPFIGPDDMEVDGDVDKLDIKGQKPILIRPNNPNGRLVVYHHGFAEAERAVLRDWRKADLVKQLIAAGYAIAATDAEGNNWGNQGSVDDYADLVAELADYGPPVHFAQSMGGLSGLLAIAQGVPAAGWFGIYPACNLADMVAAGTYAPSIEESGATANPVDLDPSAFAGLPMRFYASPDDTVVAKAENSDRMAALVAPVAAEAEVIECSGEHGDPSHFQPDDVLAFVARCFA